MLHVVIMYCIKYYVVTQDVSERPKEREDKGHHDADDDLQGQANTNIVHEGVVASLHH